MKGMVYKEMRDDKLTSEDATKALNHYLFGEYPTIEVTAFDKWDYVEVANDPRINAPRKFYDPENKSEVLNSKIRLFVAEYEWQPWTEAIEELKALMIQWRAKGWTQQADEVEHPMCGDDECDCTHSERSIYDEMGISASKVVALEFPLSECKFYKYDYSKASNGIAFHVDPNVPTGVLYGWAGITDPRQNAPIHNPTVFGDGDGSAPIYEKVPDGLVNFIPVWECSNHAPGLEVKVPVGEACSVCGQHPTSDI